MFAHGLGGTLPGDDDEDDDDHIVLNFDHFSHLSFSVFNYRQSFYCVSFNIKTSNATVGAKDEVDCLCVGSNLNYLSLSFIVATHFARVIRLFSSSILSFIHEVRPLL